MAIDVVVRQYLRKYLYYYLLLNTFLDAGETSIYTFLLNQITKYFSNI